MIKIGMIGMSDGNAHPYSWSAIINGTFDGDEIAKVGYPGVTAYLQANKDTVGIPGAQVTHIWTQDRSISESIARTTNIAKVVEQPEAMIGEVDAVILGRDDPENHREMAQPFIAAGIPIFIDKPLASSWDDLNWFTEQQAAGRFIMSCSSMRYATEALAVKTELKALGKLELITAVGKKDWKKYGVHMVEAVFSLLDDPKPLSVRHLGEPSKEVVQLELEGGIQVMLHLWMDITPTFQMSVFGQTGWRLIDMKNYYAMFKENLIEFVRSVQEGQARVSFDKTAAIMRVIIGARESFEKGGITIDLTQVK